LVAAVTLLVGAAGGTAWYAQRWLQTALEPAPAGALVVIPQGCGLRRAVDRLERAGVIRNSLFFMMLARYRGVDRRLRSGEYHFTEALTPGQVLDRLLSPESTARWITIPEGVTARQIAELLEEGGFGGRDVFECVMRDAALLRDYHLPATGVEGYLFPDTYSFEWTMEPRDIVRAMLDRFAAVSAALEEPRRAAGLSRDEMVVLASVIEKETGDPAERPLISGVFHNRLRLGMKLQSDPTVIYGRDGDWSRPLSRADLDRPTPYNTYAYAGLPRGPIANPGRAALAAALSPTATKSLYFVSRNDGSHHFSATLNEHNRAVQRYQRRGRGG
jgi:UPF0755 protein